VSEQASDSSPKLYGVLVEFDALEPFLAACERVRDAGFKRWDAHAPYPVHGLSDAMGMRMTRLPYLVFACGLSGATLALLMQWWMNAIDYPIIVSGKPLFSLPANIPVVFELTVLFAAISAFVGMFAFNGLPRLHHPLLKSERFRRVTTDRFFITIESTDPKFDAERSMEFIESLGGLHTERVEE
jgi:hypothetical protein